MITAKKWQARIAQVQAGGKADSGPQRRRSPEAETDVNMSAVGLEAKTGSVSKIYERLAPPSAFRPRPVLVFSCSLLAAAL